MAHWKLLLRCIKYVITTENVALKVKPNKLEGLAEMEVISDSEYGADQETRISVFGWNNLFLWSFNILEIKGN
jgi:hypothetical protein